MGVRLSELVVECRDPQQLADFWCAVLGFFVIGAEDEGSIEIGPAAGFGGLQPTLIFSPVETPRPARGRLHLDVNPVDGDRAGEVSRILDLGARRADVGQTGDEPWTVLADPEGNVFCVLDTPLAAR